jgi:PleD family two-component response regulator
LIRAADEAMFIAKRAGGDRVQVAEPPADVDEIL